MRSSGTTGRVGRRLRAGVSAVAAAPPATNDVVLVVDSVDATLREALWYAQETTADGFHAIAVPGRGTDPGLRARFRDLTSMRPDLEVLPTRDGRVESVIEYLWALPHGESQFVTAIVPGGARRRSAATRRTEHKLEQRVPIEADVALARVPAVAPDVFEAAPTHAVCRILVSRAHAATMRAVHYAATLGFDDTRAVFFAFDADERDAMRHEWQKRAIPGDLEIDEAPYRDIGEPLLRHLRAITADPEAVAVVVMPELIFRGWRRLLHNQRAVYVKRLLRSEPRVILVTVPYRLN